MTAASDVIEGLLHAWMTGDFDTLEPRLDRNATLRAVEPGPWDCTDRAQIMAVLRQRQAEQPNQPPRPARITRFDDATYLVANDDTGPEHGEPFPPTTSSQPVVAHDLA